VVGCPRSGTTLLQRLMLGVENSFSMPETDYFRQVAINYYLATRSSRPVKALTYEKFLSPKTLARVLTSMKKNAELNMSSEQVSELYQSATNGRLVTADLFDCLAYTYSKDSEETVLIEKTPAHVFHIPVIKSIFPDAVFVGVVRDPRDVYLSFNKMLSQQGKPDRSIHEVANMWNSALCEMEAASIPVIRYEDMILDPVGQVNAALKDTGLFVTDMNTNKNKIFQKSETWKSNVFDRIDSSNTGKYQEKLTDFELYEFQRLCRSGLLKWHYRDEQFNTKVKFRLIYLLNSIKWFGIKLIMYYKAIFQSIMQNFVRGRQQEMSTSGLS